MACTGDCWVAGVNGSLAPRVLLRDLPAQICSEFSNGYFERDYHCEMMGRMGQRFAGSSKAFLRQFQFNLAPGKLFLGHFRCREAVSPSISY